MLKYLRNKKVMKRVFWALALLIIPAFTLWGVGSIGDKEKGGKQQFSYAGKIYNKKISLEKYETSYKETEIQAKLSYGNEFDNISKFLNLGKQTWDRILLLEECRRNRINISNKELTQKIASLPFFQKDGQFNFEIYNRIIKYFFKCEPSFFEETIRNTLKITKLIDKNTEKVTISDKELKKLYKEENETAKISFLLYDSQSFKDTVTISDEEISKYYESRKDDFKLPEEATIDYAEFRFTDFRKDVKITDEELKEYYDLRISEFEKPEEIHARHILVKTEKEAREILNLLKENKDTFENLAKTRSEDPGSKTKGGDLGFFGRGRMIKEFEEAAFKLDKGQISDIVKTNFGYHIIKVEEKKSAYTEEFDSAKDIITNKLMAAKSREIGFKKASDVSGKIQKNPKNFEKILKEEKIELKTAGPFQKEGPIQSLGYFPSIQESAFSMKAGQITSALMDKDNPDSQSAFIIRLKQKFPPRIKPLNEVKEEVKNILITNKSTELARKKAEEDYKEIEALLSEEIGLEEICEILDLELKESNEFMGNSYINGLTMAKDLSDKIFSMEVGQISEPIDLKRGTCIIRLDKLSGIDENKFKEEVEDFRKKQADLKESKIIDNYLKELYEKSKIKINIKSLDELYK